MGLPGCLFVCLLKGPILSDKARNQRVVTLRINSACETMEFYSKNTRYRYRTPNLSGGAPLFIMCLCLQSTKDVFIYHRVYLVDINFFVQKYVFFCLPGTIRHSLVLQSK